MTSHLDGDSNLDSWSYQESGTPTTVQGGASIPTLNFARGVRAGEVAPEWMYETVGEFGTAILPSGLTGRYSGLAVDGFTVSGNLTHLADTLNVSRTLKPRSGTMQQVLEATFDDVGLDYTGMAVIHSGQVTLAGGFGNVWTLLNEFFAVHGVAMLLGPPIVVGSPRLLDFVDLYEATDPPSRTFDRGNPSRYVEVSYFNHRSIVNGEVYPPDIKEASVLQADAGETVETNIQLSGWLSSINQPVCVSFVSAAPHAYDGTNGVYSVAGADGRPVTPAQWAATGGWLTVELTENPDTAKVIFKAPDREDLAPYRIAMTSGNFYNSLRLTGTGVRFSEEVVKFPTGADPTLTTEDVGTTLNSVMISTRSQALQQAARIADAAGGADLGLTAQGDFPAPLTNRIVRHGDTIWQGQSVSLSPDSQSVEFEPITTLGDLEEAWAGKNLGNFEDVWVGKTLGQFNLRPLWVG